MHRFFLLAAFALLAVAFADAATPYANGTIPSPDVPIYATWYCSLTDPGTYSSCNPGACGFTVNPGQGYGITALNPAYYDGGSACHYQGSACGGCWNIDGPAGSVKVIVSDCCAGYPGACSCIDCPGQSGCDWCASGDNQHFDLDVDSFKTVCGDGGWNAGNCQLNGASQTGC